MGLEPPPVEGTYVNGDPDNIKGPDLFDWGVRLFTVALVGITLYFVGLCAVLFFGERQPYDRTWISPGSYREIPMASRLVKWGPFEIREWHKISWDHYHQINR